MIDNEKIGTHLNGMDWQIVVVDGLRHGFLTSDSPVAMGNGLGKPDGFLVLPLGPNIYFIATNRDQVAQSFIRQSARRIERAFNDAVVKQAEGWVVGHSPNHLLFVERRLRPHGPFKLLKHLHPTTWVPPF